MRCSRSFDRKAFQPEFGVYRGLARVLKSPSNPPNSRKKEKSSEKGTSIFCAKLWYAPNPGSKEIWLEAFNSKLPAICNSQFGAPGFRQSYIYRTRQEFIGDPWRTTTPCTLVVQDRKKAQPTLDRPEKGIKMMAVMTLCGPWLRGRNIPKKLF